MAVKPVRPRRLVEWLSTVGGSLGRLAAGGVCAACQAPADEGVLCERCWAALREITGRDYCRGCGHNAGPYALVDDRCFRCRMGRPALARVVRVGPYQGVLQALVLGLKFAGKSHLDQMLGALLAAAIQGDPQLTDVDALVPVPLHWRRRLRRGYNQAQLLAQAAANQLPHLHVEPFLIRTRDTVPQATLATTDRLRNLKGAFAARPNAKIAGKHLCLVDDVTTTGTTLRIAARALRRAGAAKVSAVVIAVAAN